MIKIENLFVSFDNNEILKNINLEIKEHEFLIITGNSGCGKTTLVNCLTFLEKYTSGNIMYKDKRYDEMTNRWKVKFLKEKIGIVFQGFGLIEELSVYKNLSFICKDKKKIKDVLNEFNLNIELDTKVAVLSGGERQRLALARITLKKCDIVFADEPTGNLDTENAHIVMEHLKKMNNEGKTVVVVTHDKDLLKYADNVFHIS